MDIFKGKGIDLSETPFIDNCEFFYAPLDGLYKPSAKYSEEFDFVYSRDSINNSRFFPIALHEFLALPKKNGLIILEFTKENKDIVNKIVKHAKNIYRNRAKLIKFESNGRRHLIVFEKRDTVYPNNDSVDSWTFGVITRKGSEKNLKKIIDSIRKLKIPNYEIILCGHTNLKLGNDTKLIFFDQQDDKGWITKKKNLICNSAKYENLCVLHDHNSIHNDFYSGFKKYGNYFDALFIQSIVAKNKLPDRQWTKLTFPFNHPLNRSWFFRVFLDFAVHTPLDKRDWAYQVGIPGYCTTLKKRVWKKVPWDERLFWDGGEDYDLSKRIVENGFLTRLNPNSHIMHLRCNWENYKYPFIDATREFRSRKIGFAKLSNWIAMYFLFFLEPLFKKRLKRLIFKK